METAVDNRGARSSTDSGICRTIPNGNQHHSHGMCTPLAVLDGQEVDGIAVAGIGRGALMKLNAANVKVYLLDPRRYPSSGAGWFDAAAVDRKVADARFQERVDPKPLAQR